MPIPIVIVAVVGLVVAFGAVLWAYRPASGSTPDGRLAPQYVSLAAVAHLAQADAALIESFYAQAGVRVVPSADGRMFVNADDALDLSDELLRHLANRQDVTK